MTNMSTQKQTKTSNKRSRQQQQQQQQQREPTSEEAATAATTTKKMAVTDAPATTVYSSSTFMGGGGAVKRIRTPHNHDVLSGRGGGINGHAGNIQFREWVRTRKNEYNLAANKAEKARVAKEVIALVKGQDPPGRFLAKDPGTMMSSGPAGSMGCWWVELDDDKVMAKTSQALREGAPQIRAAHKDELVHNREVHQREHPAQHHGAATHRRRTSHSKSKESGGKAGAAGGDGGGGGGSDTAKTPVVLGDGGVGPANSNPTIAPDDNYGPNATKEAGGRNTPPMPPLGPSAAAAAAPATSALAATYSSVLEQQRRQREREQREQQRRQLSSPSQPQPPAKRVRVNYNGQAVRPADDTPPLLPHEAKRFSGSAAMEDMPMLPPPIPAQSAIGGNSRRTGSGGGLGGGNEAPLHRTHSLACSESSMGDFLDDFVNPFEEEAENIQLGLEQPSPPSPSKSQQQQEQQGGGSGSGSGNRTSGAFADAPNPVTAALPRGDTSSSESAGAGLGLGMVGSAGSMEPTPFRNNVTGATTTTTSSNNNNNATGGSQQQQQPGVRSRNSLGNSSSRSLTSVLSDLPVSAYSPPIGGCDFQEGMKAIYDALHHDSDEDAIPTYTVPYRGGAFFNSRRSNSLAPWGSLDGRQ